VPILRAGLGMVNGIKHMIPEVRVGMLGMYRDEETLQPVYYYQKFPQGIEQMDVFLLDPMLATGGSSAAAVTRLKEAGCTRLRMVAILCAPEGVEAFFARHPDVPVYAAGLDRQLNERGFILPGLGDAGDRYFGT
ncbi:MAG: uracil phosphoribosyltransferase, partial [Calditrichaeota bacterium]